jgi:hypothetical protein
MSLRNSLRRKVLVFPFFGFYVKFFWGDSSSKYVLELNGNLKALADECWSAITLPVKSVCGVMLVSRKGTRVSDGALISDYLRSRIRKELENPCKCSAIEIIDFKFLSDPCFSLVEDQIASIKGVLSDVILPISSSHGDLHRDNFIFMDGELRIIDWAMYSARSSFLLDYLHFYCRETCSILKISWVEAIWLSIPEWQELSAEFDIPLDRLRLIYSIDRISLELGQYSGLLMYKPDKYRLAVDRLVGSIYPASKRVGY